MGTPTELGLLVCGRREGEKADECELSKVFAHIQAMVDRVLAELNWLGTQEPERIAMYGPFLGRSLLELGVTALIGRFDPTRLLVIKRIQEHDDYSANKPWNSSIHWQGDVLAHKVPTLWSPSVTYKDMTKALLGDYYVELFWTPAMKTLADIDFSGGNWLAELRSLTLSDFACRRRELIAKLYSFASKGIHSEFVVPPGSMYDHVTVSSQITKIVQTLAEFGLLINMIPHVAYRLDQREALELFGLVEQIEVIK